MYFSRLTKINFSSEMYLFSSLIIKKGNLFYVVQRPFKGEVGGKWEFPGGKIESNESKDEALKREIKEELDLDIKIEKFLLTSNHEYKSFKIKLHFFLCSILQGKPILTEHINEQWVLKKDINKVDFAEADLAVLDII
jgi:8-oxo-dGTP diphosphatase